MPQVWSSDAAIAIHVFGVGDEIWIGVGESVVPPLPRV